MLILFLAAYLLALAATCALMIMPVQLLLTSGHRWPALVTTIALPILLTIDRRRNWDAISYPHWALGVPTYFYHVSMAACLVSAGLWFAHALKAA
jgi:hypothetical protein